MVPRRTSYGVSKIFWSQLGLNMETVKLKWFQNLSVFSLNYKKAFQFKAQNSTQIKDYKVQT